MIPASYRPHYPIERCRRPRYRKSSGAVEALVCGAVVLAAGAVVWAVRLFR